MKCVIATAWLFVSATAALAQKADADKLCYEIGATAGAFMERRQHGTSMGEVMARLAKSNALIPLTVREMVIKAYDEPVYDTEDRQQRAIREFWSGYQFDCYKQFSEPKSKQ